MPKATRKPFDPRSQSAPPTRSLSWEHDPRAGQQAKPFRIPRRPDISPAPPPRTTNMYEARPSSTYADTAKNLKHHCISTEVPAWKRRSRDPRIWNAPPEKSTYQLQLEEEEKHYNWIIKEALPDATVKYHIAQQDISSLEQDRSQTLAQLQAIRQMQGDAEYHLACYNTTSMRNEINSKLEWARARSEKYGKKTRNLTKLRDEIGQKLGESNRRSTNQCSLLGPRPNGSGSNSANSSPTVSSSLSPTPGNKNNGTSIPIVSLLSPASSATSAPGSPAVITISDTESECSYQAVITDPKDLPAELQQYVKQPEQDARDGIYQTIHMPDGPLHVPIQVTTIPDAPM